MNPALRLLPGGAEKIPSPCVGCPVRQTGICRVLGPEELTRLARASVRRVIPRNEVVWRAGDSSGSVASLLSGAVSLSRCLPDGRQQIVALQFPTSVIGAIAGSTGLETVARETTRICAVPLRHFENVLSHNPDMEREVVRQIGIQLDEARNWLLAVGRKTAGERVASYLDMLLRNGRSSDPNGEQPNLRLPLSRGAMADFLGLTIETVSRKMTELRRAGIVEFHDASFVRILSPSGLANATGDRPFAERIEAVRH